MAFREDYLQEGPFPLERGGPIPRRILERLDACKKVWPPASSPHSFQQHRQASLSI